MSTQENQQQSSDAAWEDLSWEEKAVHLLTELDPAYAPIDTQTQRHTKTELPYYQKQILGGIAVSGKFA